MIRLIFAITMCGLVWADIANFEAFVRECSDDSRRGRLLEMRRRLLTGEMNITKAETDLIAIQERIDRVIEFLKDSIYARGFNRITYLIATYDALKLVAQADQEITVNDIMSHIDNAIVILSEIVLAIEVLENGAKEGLFKPASTSRFPAIPSLSRSSTPYSVFVENVGILGNYKIMLLTMIQDLQNIKTPLFDLTNENRCSTRRSYELSGRTYRD